MKKKWSSHKNTARWMAFLSFLNSKFYNFYTLFRITESNLEIVYKFIKSKCSIEFNLRHRIIDLDFIVLIWQLTTMNNYRMNKINILTARPSELQYISSDEQLFQWKRKEKKATLDVLCWYWCACFILFIIHIVSLCSAFNSKVYVWMICEIFNVNHGCVKCVAMFRERSLGVSRLSFIILFSNFRKYIFESWTKPRYIGAEKWSPTWITNHVIVLIETNVEIVEETAVFHKHWFFFLLYEVVNALFIFGCIQTKTNPYVEYTIYGI